LTFSCDGVGTFQFESVAYLDSLKSGGLLLLREAVIGVKTPIPRS
jgi:hypothetical protein